MHSKLTTFKPGDQALAAVIRALDRDGFAVLQGVVVPEKVEPLAKAYDVAIASAAPEEIHVGRTSTRVEGILNRVVEFDGVLIHRLLLAAAQHIIGGRFHFSSLHARTLRPGGPSQELHIDVQHDSEAWPLVGFILMFDAFRTDNGATRFVPGFQCLLDTPNDDTLDFSTFSSRVVLACGLAGSLLIFNGSTWHGHTANVSSEPRRSIQGAFIPRDAQAAVDWSTRLPREMMSGLIQLIRFQAATLSAQLAGR